MALCPFAVQRLITPGANDPMIKPRVGIWHVDAANAETLYDYFLNRSGGVESHFFIKHSGVLEQYRDTEWEADANYLANPFAVSVETQGFADGFWTAAALDTSQRLMRWLNAVHGIPFRKVQRWDGSGFGYHTQFGAPGQWTPFAKTCPGKNRIVQFDTILVPWLDKGAPPDRKPTLNISAALSADSRMDRIVALRQVVKHGDDQASAAAKTWLAALQAIEDAKRATKVARQELKTFEVK